MMTVMPSMYVIIVALLPVCSRNQRGKVSLIPVEKNCRFVSFFTCSGRHLLVNPSAGIRSRKSAFFHRTCSLVAVIKRLTAVRLCSKECHTGPLHTFLVEVQNVEIQIVGIRTYTSLLPVITVP
jgi:hypothetical protein